MKYLVFILSFATFCTDDNYTKALQIMPLKISVVQNRKIKKKSFLPEVLFGVSRLYIKIYMVLSKSDQAIPTVSLLIHHF